MKLTIFRKNKNIFNPIFYISNKERFFFGDIPFGWVMRHVICSYDNEDFGTKVENEDESIMN